MVNPSRARQPWTDEEINILKQLWPKRDITDEDISRVLKRTPMSIYHKGKQLKLASRYQTFAIDIDREYLKQLMEVVDG